MNENKNMRMNTRKNNRINEMKNNKMNIRMYKRKDKCKNE